MYTGEGCTEEGAGTEVVAGTWPGLAVPSLVVPGLRLT